jgi:DNA helicase-2/ATP-dependent DNA helicase PcrA
VCVVGDPDQSIYGWRGADISNILDFEETYPGAKVIALGQNFRSTPDILAAADGLIRRNKQRKHKPLFTEHAAGRKPEIILCRDEHHEADLVLDWIKNVRAGGEDEAALDWKDFAVFYRNNALSRVIEDRLRTAGVPYVMVRGTAFYQREEVRDAVAYLRVVANPADEISLRRIINKPARKIGPATVERLAEFALGAGTTLFGAMLRIGELTELGPAAVMAVRKFVDLINTWTAGGTFMGAGVPDSLPDLVSRVLSESGLEAHYRAEREKSPEEDADRLANLEEMVSSARDFAEGYDPAADAAMDAPREGVVLDAPPLLAMLRAYLERVSLVADADAIDPAAGAVTLMTLHAAKGLEFPGVAMIGLEEGLLPSARAMENEPGEPEEERRLCFVGITRAMRRLLITSAKYRAVRGLRERTIPSRFLSELPRENVILSDQSDTWSEQVDDGGRYDEGDEDGPRRGRAGMQRGWSGGASTSPDRKGAGGKFGAPGGRPVTSVPGSFGGRGSADDPEYPAGCKVRHAQFGVGTVREVSGVGINRRAVIAFQQAGLKTLVLQYARLERVS